MPSKAKANPRLKKPTTISKKQQKVDKLDDNSKILSSTWELFKKTLETIKFQQTFLFISILVYVILSILFVINVSAFTGINTTKNGYIHGLSTVGANLSASISTLGSVSGTISTSSNSSGSVIQFMLFILFSLVFIKGIREANKSRKLKFAEGIYSSTYPFVQFILVILLLAVEFLPVLLSLFLAQAIFTNGIAANFIEKIVWLTICAFIFSGGLYLLLSSIFALFITTLPNMRPWASLKSSWKIVKNNRLLVFRKILAMILCTLIGLGLMALILVFIVPVISAWIILILGIFAIMFIYTFLYNLYKELL